MNITSQKFFARIGTGTVAAALLLSGSALLANAQTINTTGTTSATVTGTTGTTGTTPGGTTMTDTGTGSTGVTTPGAPNTGAGGDAATNLALLATAGIAAIGGATYLARRGAARVF